MLGNFACGRYRFVLEATTPLWLSAFAGATLRGGFGHVFKRTVCTWPPGDCSRCLLKTICAYPYVFETSPPPGSAKLRTVDQVPRPYVIEPPEGGRHRYQPGERLDFQLVLIGRGIDYLPYFLHTFRELGQAGLGSGMGQYRVVEVDAESRQGTRVIYRASSGVLEDGVARTTAADLAATPAAGTQLAVHFLTPTRIRNDGAFRGEVSFQDLVRALLRRLSSLCYFHCGCELDVDFRGLIDDAGRVRTVRSDLRWYDQDRLSGRQGQRIEMGGVLGRVLYEVGEAAAWGPFLPLLAAGEWVHVGKGSVMGLGKYRVEERS